MTLIMSVLLAATGATNLRPLIGIVSQPTVDSNGSYIAASYVKWVESAGARAVPLIMGRGQAELEEVLRGVNGLLWPGGGADIQNASSFYLRFASHLWRTALAINDGGTHFPQWGTCLGFEFVHVMVASGSLKCDYDAEDLPLALNFSARSRESRLLAGLPDALYRSMASERITQNEHGCGVPPDAYARHPALAGFFTTLATNRDREGRPFVSLVEGKSYPVYAMQAHPEKNVFEWTTGE